jgi:hypothetical protein
MNLVEQRLSAFGFHTYALGSEQPAAERHWDSIWMKRGPSCFLARPNAIHVELLGSSHSPRSGFGVIGRAQ